MAVVRESGIRQWPPGWIHNLPSSDPKAGEPSNPAFHVSQSSWRRAVAADMIACIYEVLLRETSGLMPGCRHQRVGLDNMQMNTYVCGGPTRKKVCLVLLFSAHMLHSPLSLFSSSHFPSSFLHPITFNAILFSLPCLEDLHHWVAISIEQTRSMALLGLWKSSL